MPSFIIEISTQGDVITCTNEGESLIGSDFERDFLDCTGSGDAEPACEYIRDTFEIDWRIVARNAAGDYENRTATPEEKAECARAIYFESDSDFEGDESLCENYLIWQAAHDIEYERSNGEG
jgi:hypothetical protein